MSDEMNHQPALLNERAMAKELSISPRKLWDDRVYKGVPHIRIGSRVLYNPTRVLAHYEAKQGGSHGKSM